jgi:hypothetical protein
MFKNEKLQRYLETSSSIKTQPAVIAEWNLNFAENISTIGNYRYRPTALPNSEDAVFANIANSFDINDAENEIKFYTGATDAAFPLTVALVTTTNLLLLFFLMKKKNFSTDWIAALKGFVLVQGLTS